MRHTRGLPSIELVRGIALDATVLLLTDSIPEGSPDPGSKIGTGFRPWPGSHRADRDWAKDGSLSNHVSKHRKQRIGFAACVLAERPPEVAADEPPR